MSAIVTQEFFKLLDNAVPPLTYSIHPSCQQYFPLFPESFIFFLYLFFLINMETCCYLSHTKKKQKTKKTPFDYHLNSKYYPFLSLFSRVGCTHCYQFSSPTCCELPTLSGLLITYFLCKILNIHHSTLNFLSLFPLYFFLPALNTNTVRIFPYLSGLFSV